VLPATGKIARRHHRDRREARDGGAGAAPGVAEAAVGLLSRGEEGEAALHRALLLGGDLVPLNRVVDIVAVAATRGGACAGVAVGRDDLLLPGCRRRRRSEQAQAKSEDEQWIGLHGYLRSCDRFWLRLR